MKRQRFGKRFFALAASSLFLLPSLSLFSGCGEETTVLRVYNWEEYIDEGGEDSYAYDPVENPDAPSMIEDFEAWYKETYHKSVRVEYSTFGTNEDLYNQLKLGNQYDLVCPSEYMIMKLAAENMLEPLSKTFFDKENELNYYVNNVSPYIAEVFESGTVPVNGEARRWSEFAAGYMWGTTGLVYNPEYVTEEALEREGWRILLDPAYEKRVTTKDNVRDSYFVGLGILYQDELLALKERYEQGEISSDSYHKQVTDIMNRTDEETVSAVQDILIRMKQNIFGFETDTGKSDMVKGTIYINFAWSGDAVYAMDLADEDDVTLCFFNPNESANLFFDGWCMPKGANREVAEAFINFMAIPENAVRNMDYIGYTSVIAGEEVYSYAVENYGVEEGDEDEAVPYDLSYFFGEEKVLYTYEDQLNRQLYGQFPPLETVYRCAVMDYYGDREERINELWTKVKGESLDAWAIAVICVAVVFVVGFVLFVKFGSRIDFFRLKPKKGYELVKQEPYRE